jgi:hypothetical protein
MFFGKSLLVLLLVFRNCYLKEVATNTRPWGQEITIQNCHLGFHIDISSTEKNKGPSPSIYPKAGYHLFPPITSLHFFGLQPFASRCKQPLSVCLCQVPSTVSTIWCLPFQEAWFCFKKEKKERKEDMVLGTLTVLYNKGTKCLAFLHSSRKKFKSMIFEMVSKAHKLSLIHQI